ncbi:MAG: hypothetical protein JXQ75_03445 [Phycisphaerae bacterium]|nr:hypothetical protein [Phycisphaerae bacterium]
MADYIPSADAAFNTWLDNFVTYAGANFADLGLQQTDVDPVVAARGNAGTRIPSRSHS